MAPTATAAPKATSGCRKPRPYYSGSGDRYAVHHVHRKVHGDIGDGDEQDAPLNQRVVPSRSTARNSVQYPARQNRLGDDGARQHGAALEPEDRHDRNQAVAKRMRTPPAPGHTAGAGRQHVQFAQLLDHAGPRHPRQDRSQWRPERDCRQDEMREGATARHGQPAEGHGEDDGQQRPKPEVRHRDAQKRHRRRRVIDRRVGSHGGQDAKRHRDSSATSIAAAASSSVAGIRSRISDTTG